jgi:hypothetical protein
MQNFEVLAQFSHLKNRLKFFEWLSFGSVLELELMLNFLSGSVLAQFWLSFGT